MTVPGDAPIPADAGDDLLIVPIPALVALLVAARSAKGAELDEADVLAIRDGAVCMAMPADVARRMAEARGYDDLDPEHVWEDWQAFRAAVDLDALTAPEGGAGG